MNRYEFIVYAGRAILVILVISLAVAFYIASGSPPEGHRWTINPGLAGIDPDAARPMVTPTPGYYPDLFVSMRRVNGFSGEDHRWTIDGDGNASYVNRGSGPVLSVARPMISAQQVEELVAAIRNANVFALKDEYSIFCIDCPTMWLSITLNGRTKSIQHYGNLNCDGSSDKAPMALCDLERKIYTTANLDPWRQP